MTVFADSSALVKLYADEAGHRAIRGIRRAMVVSAVARVEVVAALWRKVRLGELAAGDAQVLASEFGWDWHGSPDGGDARFVVLAPAATVLEEAAAMVAAHGLRAYDGVQLASAVAARRAVPGCTHMAVFDRGLRQAAAAEGFGLIPPG